jgi:hydrogenase maturation protein HypF
VDRRPAGSQLSDSPRVGLRIRIRGIVQGVGFRPFIYRLAREHGVRGSVSNSPEGVVIDAAGDPGDLEAFVTEIRERRPAAARITALETQSVTLNWRKDFTIEPSRAGETPTALIPPDIAVCDACLAELFDPSNRRHRYPFINCTDCGPRFTLIQGLPYDRPKTTMARFQMCAACQSEYDDPLDRRFHAQPNACAQCGPKLLLFDAEGSRIVSSDPIAESVQHLAAGDILAVKGIGGFHLAVDATNDPAVQRLRSRKHREEKPLALMARSLARVAEFCEWNDGEAELLIGPERPIVLLRRRSTASSLIADSVAPGQASLGVMLPYTPLHALLLDSALHAIVLTSGNLSEEPIAYQDPEARQRLAEVADVVLTHDREIHRRADDSVARVAIGGVRLLRRARGYAPRPVALRRPVSSVLAVGAQLKSTICLTRGQEAFLSPHIGDLDNVQAFDAFKSMVKHLSHTLEVEPVAVAHDLHPDYLSTRWALAEADLPALGVQHHHAHVAAVLAEHGLEGPVVGLALDGTGFGVDGQVWGGEVLVADLLGFVRAAHLPYVPLLGGEAAVKEPWRMALAWLHRIYGRDLFDLQIPLMASIDRDGARRLLDAHESGFPWPLTSSCGRLFDAVAALTSVKTHVNYEGQAAMELEGAAEPFSLNEDIEPIEGRAGEVPVESMVSAAVTELEHGLAPGKVAARFHLRLAAALVRVAASVAKERSLDRVALAGGCFQNRILLTEVHRGLRNEGLEVLVPSQVPANDGGIALGQAAVAAARMSP